MRPDWRIVVLGALFMAFLVVGYVSDRGVMQAASELQHLAKGVEAAIHTENWFAASQLLDNLSAGWPPIRRAWDLRMDRDEMDELDLCLARLQGYASQKDKAGALSELGVWRVLITHVQQKEVFRWRNLL
ncbi:MAG: DUF4363 family protein [Firmicutes bacterium]|nr:DUF4363 family protein [Bacillota bacterium]